MCGSIKKQKIALVERIDNIDKDSEINGLSRENYLLRKDLNIGRIFFFQRRRDLKRKSCWKGMHSLITSLLGLVVGREINRITSFNLIDNVVQGDKDLLDYATSFYKNVLLIILKKNCEGIIILMLQLIWSFHLF